MSGVAVRDEIALKRIRHELENSRPLQDGSSRRDLRTLLAHVDELKVEISELKEIVERLKNG